MARWYRSEVMHWTTPPACLFLWDKVKFFSPVKQYVLPLRICPFFCNKHSSSVYQQYFFCHKNFISYEVGVVLSVSHFSRQMRGIYNQNFLWDLKISWEPGSQVPRDSPTLEDTPPHEKKYETIFIPALVINGNGHVTVKCLLSFS